VQYPKVATPLATKESREALIADVPRYLAPFIMRRQEKALTSREHPVAPFDPALLPQMDGVGLGLGVIKTPTVEKALFTVLFRLTSVSSDVEDDEAHCKPEVFRS
jgi:hypothetical protein